ncbi:DNA-processing protein DprA [Labrys sp. KNU-23]|uniref:DNA-processing protein DprA n=1 Tax=Labrys sp. KNU-23 TaxID=2789216 RepID=UPI0011EECE5F|nr:DNA-processing protein DprA [Labrys sp. KNU-23]QEN84736.1 DNA-processing protein DprA [Labrys sp. KNU-23]
MEEARAFLALAAVRGVGHKTLIDVLEAGYRFRDILEMSPSEAFPLPRHHPKPNGPPVSWSEIRDRAQVEGGRMGELLARLGVALIFRDDPRFPISLFDLEQPPHWLFVQGALDPLRAPSVAIVGTRKPTQDGLFLARYVGACLTDWRVVTVSGLAVGIDQLAHESSIVANVPTIAVLGTGMLDNYPKGSHILRDRILSSGGTIVSEYLPRASYSAQNFVQRNRLQAALGRMLIPVEWARRSGTAHTVRFAADMKRPIACLRLPEWPTDRVVLEPGLGRETGEIFTVPREQHAFDKFVRAAIQDPVLPSGQLSFFDGD